MRTIHAECLEPRRLLSAVYPSPYEQYMVELYNWARANPSAAAAKYGVALNEGLTPGRISIDPKQPVTINPYITDGARQFAQWMIDHDLFGHTVDGKDPGTRMAAAGYADPWSWGENIALVSSSVPLDPTGAADTEFRNYYVDGDIVGRGHRLNMLDPNWKEIGSGQGSGIFEGDNAIITVQDFAYKGTNSFLTGVAYTDSNHNNFYTPGEQMAGAAITAIRSSDNATFTTTTWSSGGYSLALPAGSYTVWAGGGTLGGFVKYSNVVVGTENVKKDFRPDLVNSSTGPGTQTNAFAQLAAGKLTITGTSSADTLTLGVASAILSVTLNSETLTFSSASISSIVISTGDGNDSVILGASVIGSTVLTGNGNDSIQGGAGKDIIKAGAGNDRILGGNNNDKLYGEAGNDSIWGQSGNDFIDASAGTDYISGGANIDTIDYSTRTAALFVELAGVSMQPSGRSGEVGENDNILTDVENINGGSGNDRLVGSASANVIHGNAGNDTIYGLAGADMLYGEDGKDRFSAIDSTKDTIDGGAHADSASADLLDLLISVESH